MNRDGPVIIINNDLNNQKLLLEVFNKLEYTNEVVFFNYVDKALDYLEKSKKNPFLILLEINQHLTESLPFKIQLQRNAALQTIPHIFFSRNYDKKIVAQAYSLNNQGFFIMKNVDDMVDLITVVIEYWKRTVSPLDFSSR